MIISVGLEASAMTHRFLEIATTPAVRAAQEAGRTEAEVVAMKPAATYALGGDADRFVAAIYDSYANP